jgi:hypothetical protein
VAVYRLSPISGKESALAWHQSCCAEICWVNASSETEARKDVTEKTLKAKPVKKYETKQQGPWDDASLSNCTIDETGVSVPPGKVLEKSGKLYGD